ncbi:unnamed protein product [Brassica oleracea var. botrytis]
MKTKNLILPLCLLHQLHLLCLLHRLLHLLPLTSGYTMSFRASVGKVSAKTFLVTLKRSLRETITFFNDNGIERGESIAPELIRGIRGSNIAIVLLSRNYASSKWCLEELVEIMKCREELGQTVIAIFYTVDPSDVKKLTGDFGKVFRKTCKGKAKEEIRRWKQALEKVAIIAGYHLSNWDDEATVIEDISTYVLNKLVNSPQPSHFDNLVGMSTHMIKLKLLLRPGSNEVRMIGIWGPSGIGKSTIARVLFSHYSCEFQFSVFMENIKRLCPRPYYDEYSVKLRLQEEFLSRIINQKDIKIQQLGVVEDRLKDKRVLAILDDVDHSLQIDAIAKEARWFGPGSWIILTTQDKRLLSVHGIDHIYEVEFPPDDEALEIFCMNAFGQKSPHDGFQKLAWEVTRLAGNLPLGLRVMGSHFRRRPKHEWEEELPRLRTRLDGEIEHTLKFSYDALCDDNQAIFLHLACFLKGESLETVERCLEKNFVGVKGCLRVLAEKSLISFELGRIKMHDLLALLGREIVRKQFIYEPGQRQFLVDAEDICQVLRNDTLGSRNVIGIDLDLSNLDSGLKISDRVFERMSNVQFLRIKYGYGVGDMCQVLHKDKLDSRNVIGIDLDLRKLETELKIIEGVFKRMSNNQFVRIKNSFHSIDPVTCLPSNPRILHWHFFPMTCLPSNINLEFLVEIILIESNFLEKLWEGNKTIRNLKLMRLSGSKNLKELPDLSTATNLQSLDLNGCPSLTKLPYSIGNAINLRYLDLRNCSSLVDFPSSMENVTTLEELLLTGCSSLVELPSSVKNSLNLIVFMCGGCSNLVELPLYIPASCHKEIDLRGCSSLRELPSSIGNMTSLEELNLNGCSSLVELPPSIGNMTSLEELNLNECSSLVQLPSSIGNLTNLMKLDLSGCSSLRELPSSIGNMNNLEELSLERCSNLTVLPININMKSRYIFLLTDCSPLRNALHLKVFTCSGCSNLVELPLYFDNANVHLKRLDLNGCSSLVELPSSIGNLTSLEELNLNGCSSLVELASSIGNMTSLEELNLNGCSSLVELPPSIGNMTSLEELNLNGCSSLVELPSSSGDLIRLKTLNLNGCSSLVQVPSSIGNLTYLMKLDLGGCSSLQELPSSMGKMIHLFRLYLNGYSNLLKALPININMKYLDELLLTDCSSLKSFPEISTNISVLKLTGTSIEEFPPSIMSWPHLSDDTGIQETAPWDKEITDLRHLIIKGCTKQVSFPHDCKYLKRFHFSIFTRTGLMFSSLSTALN